MNNNTVFVVMHRNEDMNTSLCGVFSTRDRAEEWVVCVSDRTLMRSYLTDNLFECKMVDGIYHTTDAMYSIVEQPIR